MVHRDKAYKWLLEEKENAEDFERHFEIVDAESKIENRCSHTDWGIS